MSDSSTTEGRTPPAKDGLEKGPVTTELGVNRRDLLRSGAAASTIIGAMGAPTMAFASGGLEGETFGESPNVRAQRAEFMRNQNAKKNRLNSPNSEQPNNTDEETYADFRGSFSKTLRHNQFGEVRPNSYQSYLRALDSRDNFDFENILVGAQNDPNRIGLVSPQAAFAFDQSGRDGNTLRMPIAPTFNSAETAAEMGELYCMALCRDIPFTEYENRNLIQRCSDDLNAFSRSDIFPNENGAVTPATIFRGTLPGAEVGPFISQFLYLPFNFGRLEVEQRYDRPTKGAVNDFMTDYDEWLRIQRGRAPSEGTTFSGQKRFIATLRDGAEFVHVDFPVQSPLYAFLILLGFGGDAIDPNIPYTGAADVTQDPFVSFG
ncbi:MAG: hypothetical protein AAGJ87_17055, partial [Pseudomonadota bacterium]